MRGKLMDFEINTLFLQTENLLYINYMASILKIIFRLVKIVAIVVVVFLLLIFGGVWLLNSSSFQDKFLSYATETLQEKLKTKVEIDSIRIGFFSDDVRLYKLRVEDLQHRPMLNLDFLGAEIDMWALLKSEIQLEEVTVKGLHAQIFKERPDTAANYQFVIDAFKSDKKAPKPKKKKSGKQLTFDLDEVNIEDVDVIYNQSHFSLGHINLHKGWGDKITGEVRKAQGSWIHMKKRKPVKVDNRMMIDVIKLSLKGDGKEGEVAIDSVHWTTDNHLPHKRVGKPKRGWFDDGHLKVVAHAKLHFSHISKDSVCGRLTECDVNDKASGLHITDLHLAFKHIAGKIHINDATICMANTTLKFAKGEVQLGSKKKGIPFQFSTSDITGTTLLKDIAHPFAPALKNFSLPLWLTTKFYGNDSTLFFKDVAVKTTDNKFRAKAVGSVAGLKDKYKLHVHFDILSCEVQGNSKARIINQFAVRKFMMKQLHALGTIRYKGSFDVKYKRLEFRGNILSACGDIGFSFLINNLNKYLTGNVKSDVFHLGKAMDYPDIGRISCRAGFKIDISKERTAVMRRQKGGKLPIGQVDALVYEAQYKKVSVTDIYANIVSDGAVAEGKLKMKGKLADILCAFSFTDTDQMQKTKIKPGIRFHLFNNDNDNDPDKADRERHKAMRKAAKEKEREAKKKQKELEKQKENAEKEKKAAAKAAEKERKAAEKAAEKERKAAERAARKQQKAAEKAARKAAKEAAKNQD